MRFSIIVPVYNTKQYLEACIASVRSQEFYSWELIFVDDGSTDGSEKLLQEYAKEDSRIRVLQQKNSGQFYARQKGIEAAEGEYILFLDSDDELTQDSLQVLDKAIGKKDPDMVLYTGKMRKDGLDTQRRIGWISSEEQEVSVLWLRQQLISSNNMNSLWLKAIRRSLFSGDKTDYSCFMGKSYGEDKVRLLYPLSVAKSIFYIPNQLYLYNYRMESTMHRISLSAAPRLIGNDMFSLLYQYMQLWNMVDRRSLEMLSVYYLKNYLSVYFGLRNQCRNSQERKVLRKYPWGQIVNKKAFRHCFSRQLSLKDKLRLLVAAMRL